MLPKIYRFAAAAVLYVVTQRLTEMFFVLPPDAVNLASFLPVVLSFAGGFVAALGTAAGALVGGASANEFFAVFLSGFLPYKLWHLIRLKGATDVFAVDTRNLPKFIGILLLTELAVSLVMGLSLDPNDTARLLADADVSNMPQWERVGSILLIYFNIKIFFGMPLIFILMDCGYDFYRPDVAQNKAFAVPKIIGKNHLAFDVLYAFFVLLFVLLDLSGIIYDLDRMDTYLRFNGEIMTMMNVSLTALMYMLLKYRDSIMTNLTLMELIIIFAAAFLLGSVSFAAISGIIDEHVDNDLQKMSVIYRERLTHTFTNARMAINSMQRLAFAELTDYEQIKNDADYRKNYLAAMERNFSAIAESTVGSIGFYMQLSSDIDDGAGFLCTRQPKNWGGKMPSFVKQDTNIYADRYHVPYERYIVTISEPYPNEYTGRYMLSYVVPISKDDKFFGIIGIDIDFNYIIHEIRRMSVYENGYVCLIDKNGDVLYENQPLDENIRNKGGLYETEAYLSNGIWLKIAAYSHDIYAGRNNMLIHFVVVMLFAVVVVAFFSIWIASKGIRPLMLITEAAKKIAVGDLDVDLSYPVKNELGTLVDSIKEMAAKLNEHVYHDKLTGLLNTAAYVRAVGELEKRRCEKRIEFAVAVFDVNFLKKINDTYGHEAGNELICRAGDLIKEVFSAKNVYRVGGDEFVAILEDEHYEQREALLKKFDEVSTAEYLRFGDEKIKVSVARGFAVWEQNQEFSEVFRNADAEMYKHKSALKAVRK